MKPILLALFEFSLSNGTRKELFEIYFLGIYLNNLGENLMHVCLVWIDSNLSDGVGVVSEPEGKPPTQFQTWSNLGII